MTVWPLFRSSLDLYFPSPSRRWPVRADSRRSGFNVGSPLHSRLGAEAALGDFALSVVSGLRKIESYSVDRIAAVSLEYELRDNLSISTGYRFLQEEGETAHTMGMLLTYEFGLN